jgi:hypothetical protein
LLLPRLQREDLDFKRRRGEGPGSFGEPDTAGGGGEADVTDTLADGAMSVAEGVGPSTVACMGRRTRLKGARKERKVSVI